MEELTSLSGNCFQVQVVMGKNQRKYRLNGLRQQIKDTERRVIQMTLPFSPWYLQLTKPWPLLCLNQKKMTISKNSWIESTSLFPFYQGKLLLKNFKQAQKVSAHLMLQIKWYMSIRSPLSAQLSLHISCMRLIMHCPTQSLCFMNKK